MDKYDSRIMNLLTSMFNTMEVSDIMTDDIRKEYDIFISGRVGQIATGEDHSNDDIEMTLTNYALDIIKNAYFLVFRSSDRAVIYYNNNKMGRNTTQIEYYCMDNEISRKVLINPTTRVMKLVRTNV